MQRGDRERRPQEAIAADLSSGDPDRIGPAFAEMSSMPPSEWGAELRGALLDAFTREIEEEAFGDDPHYAIHPMGELATQIAALGDARAAPVLARYGGFGPRVLELLVELGDPGLQALLEFAPDTQPHDNGSAVDHMRLVATLHLFVYRRGVNDFEAGAMARIRELAERALAGPTDPQVLEWGAMGLGLLVGGSALRAVVEEMAASDEAVRRRLFVPTQRGAWNADYEAFWIGRIRRAVRLQAGSRVPEAAQLSGVVPKPPN